jgi:hypothetical protein
LEVDGASNASGFECRHLIEVSLHEGSDFSALRFKRCVADCVVSGRCFQITVLHNFCLAFAVYGTDILEWRGKRGEERRRDEREGSE